MLCFRYLLSHMLMPHAVCMTCIADDTTCVMVGMTWITVDMTCITVDMTCMTVRHYG